MTYSALQLYISLQIPNTTEGNFPKNVVCLPGKGIIIKCDLGFSLVFSTSSSMKNLAIIFVNTSSIRCNSHQSSFQRDFSYLCGFKLREIRTARKYLILDRRNFVLLNWHWVKFNFLSRACRTKRVTRG